MSNAMVWTWFAAAWIFILAVIFKHWFHREHADQAATDKRLEETAPAVPAGGMDPETAHAIARALILAAAQTKRSDA